MKKINNIKSKCPICKKYFELLQNIYKRRIERSKSGKIFCSRKCSAQNANQYQIDKWRLAHPPKKCLQCNKETKNPKFCSSSCAALYNNPYHHFKNDVRTKFVKCKGCKSIFKVKIRSSAERNFCKDCKRINWLKNKRKCKYCGEPLCPKPKICHLNRHFTILIKYFGFKKSAIGGLKIYKEYKRIRNKLIKEYTKNRLTLTDLCKKYKHPNIGNLYHTLKILGIIFRPAVSNRFKTGWHITWYKKKIFYRSSYELNYAKELDNQKIPYEVESLTIPYWDIKLQKERTAHPDFYLLNSNTIVEIKSIRTYDEQNMRDRFKAFKKFGYGCRLIFGCDLIDVTELFIKRSFNPKDFS